MVGPIQDPEVIRTDAGMSTSSFCRIIDMPKRRWRRWQAREGGEPAESVADACLGHIRGGGGQAR